MAADQRAAGFTIHRRKRSKILDPTSYFSSYNGTYSGFGGFDLFISTQFESDAIAFTVSSVTISTAAIPEPSTYATAAACVALAMAGYRRRSAKRSPQAVA